MIVALAATASRHDSLLCLHMQEHTFALGERVGVLAQVDQAAVIPHMAEMEGRRFPYEVGIVLTQWCVLICQA